MPRGFFFVQLFILQTVAFRKNKVRKENCKYKVYSFNETTLISSLNVTMSYIVFGDSSDINLTKRRTIEFSTFIIFNAVINAAAPRST